MKLVSTAIIVVAFTIAPRIGSPQAFVVSPVAIPNQPLPLIRWNSFSYTDGAGVNNAGDVVFDATYGTAYNPSQGSGIFLYVDGTILPIALTGDSAPGTGGGAFRLPGGENINDSGDIAFGTYFSGGDFDAGIYLFSKGALTPIALIKSGSLGRPLLNNRGDVVFSYSSPGHFGTICRYSNGITTPLVHDGMSAPGTSGGQFLSFEDYAFNDVCDVVFKASLQGGNTPSGLFVLSNGIVTPAVLEGQSAPGTNGNFDLFDLSRPNSSGAFVFRGFRQTGIGQYGIRLFGFLGLFLYKNGSISPLVLPSDLPAGYSTLPRQALSIDNNGIVLFEAHKGGQTKILSVTDGTAFPVAMFSKVDGKDVAETSRWLRPLWITDSNTIVSAGGGELFLATPVETVTVPNGGFENSSSGDLPSAWTIAWNNEGLGSAWRYDSNGDDSFSGKTVLRMHTAQGGGMTFVLSDAISAPPNTACLVTAQMRYYLGANGRAFFTVIQYDARGNEIAFGEAIGLAGDNFWSWKQKSVLAYTRPDAVSIRIRFSLSAPSESYLDIDAVH